MRTENEGRRSDELAASRRNAHQSERGESNRAGVHSSSEPANRNAQASRVQQQNEANRNEQASRMQQQNEANRKRAGHAQP